MFMWSFGALILTASAPPAPRSFVLKEVEVGSWRSSSFSYVFLYLYQIQNILPEAGAASLPFGIPGCCVRPSSCVEPRLGRPSGPVRVDFGFLGEPDPR